MTIVENLNTKKNSTIVKLWTGRLGDHVEEVQGEDEASQHGTYNGPGSFNTRHVSGCSTTGE